MNQRIRIRRIDENQRTVLYAFQPEGEGEGILLLDRGSGKIVEVQPVDHPRGPRFFRRAGRKVYQHWQRGEFPAETWWGAPRLVVRATSTARFELDEKKSV